LIDIPVIMSTATLNGGPGTTLGCLLVTACVGVFISGVGFATGRGLRDDGFPTPVAARGVAPERSSHSTLAAAAAAVAATATPASAVAAGRASESSHLLCELEGVAYECAPLFDWRFYTAAHADLAKMGAGEAYQHWLEHGIAEGRRFHAGRRVLKVVLMTKDEMPLLRSWVLYHAHTFGAHNVYVVDGSTDPSAVAFLDAAAARLGVHVFHAAAGLNDLEALLTRLMGSVCMSADYMVKVDSDEFIALHGGGGITVEGVSDYVDRLVVPRSALSKVGWMAMAPPQPQSCELDDPSAQTGFAAPTTATGKTLFYGPSFLSVDLGSHRGQLRQPFDGNAPPFMTDLITVHFRMGCYDRVQSNNRKALLSHGYMAAGDDDQTAIAKLTEVQARYPGKCIASCHKVIGYLEHLRDANASRTAYYSRNGVALEYAGLRDLVAGLTQRWLAGA
jgi:hypothetical protein